MHGVAVVHVLSRSTTWDNTMRTIICLFETARLSALIALCLGWLAGCGGGGGDSTHTVAADTTPAANPVPSAVSDRFQANRNERLIISVTSILANDFDPEGDAITFQRIEPVTRAQGTVVRNGEVIEYMPPKDFVGEDELTYYIADSALQASEGRITVAVRLPDAPLAQDDVFLSTEDQRLVISIVSLLANDLSSNVGTLQFVSATATPDTHGQVVFDGAGVSYSPDLNYAGRAQFLYSVSDGMTTSTASVTVLIDALNDPPLTQNDNVQGLVDVPIELNVLANDMDPDRGDTITVQSVEPRSANGGTIQLESNGLITFMPAAVEGRDTFGYTVVDSSGATSSSTVDVNVSAALGFNEALYAVIDPNITTNIATSEQAFDELTAVPGNGWVADRTGSRLAIRFDQAKSLHKISLQGITGAVDQIIQSSILFSDGSILSTGTISNDGTPRTLYFKPRAVTGFEIVVSEVSGPTAGFGEVAAFSALPGQTLLANESFHNVAMTGWTQSAEFDTTSKPSVWSVANDVYHQTTRTLEQTQDGYQLGVFSVWEYVHSDMDLRARLRVDRPDNFEPGVTGIIFAMQDNDNYYRFTMSRHSSYHRLEKKVGGVFTELASSSASVLVGEWMNVRIVAQNGVIVIQVNGQPALAASDSTFLGGKIALWNSWIAEASYDKVAVLSAPPAGLIGFTTPPPLHVFREGSVTVRVAATQPVTGIEYVVDDGSQAAQVQKIFSAPYRADFDFISSGTHAVTAYALENNGARSPGADAIISLPSIGVFGKQIVSIGDSITNGVFDDIVADDASADGRFNSGGFQAILNNRLTQSAGVPVTVFDKSNPGDKAADGVTKINRMLSAHAQADAVLIMYGTNDTEATSVDPGVAVADYTSQMRAIVDAAITATSSAKIFLARIPPVIGRPARNQLARSFNTAIADLVAEFAATHPGRVLLGPDFFAHFNTHPTEMNSDGFHPNGIGYQSMAALWFDAIAGKI